MFLTPISCPILSISYPISDTYRSIPVSCHLRYRENLIRYRRFFRYRTRYRARYSCLPVSFHLRYRVFRRYRLRYVSDIANNIGIYGYRRQKHTTSPPMWNQYRNIPISALLRYRGQNHDIGAAGADVAQPPPAGRAGPRRATAQAWSSARPDSL